MILFSYDYMAMKLNEQGAYKINQLKTGKDDFNRHPLSLKDVVRSFQSHWQQGENFIKANSAEPEISIKLTHFKVIPQLHRTLRLSFLENDIPSGSVVIELSKQLDQHFYYSEQIPLSDFLVNIELSELNWTGKEWYEGEFRSSTVDWFEIKPLDALVFRFYNTELGALKLSSISINQTDTLKEHLNTLPCAEKHKTVQCVLTNLMKFNHLGNIQDQGFSNITYTTLTEISPLLWLLAAWLTAMFLLRLIKLDQLKIYVWVSAVFLAIFLMHYELMVQRIELLFWPVVFMILALVWIKRKCFLKPSTLAIKVWLGSLVLFLLMQTISPGLGFVAYLPTYFLWAMVQQLMIGPLFSDMIYQEGRVSKGLVACLVGVLFSVVHAPNHVLMIATLIGGVGWSYVWLTYKNIYANAFSHALLALMLYQVMPEAWLGSARVGIFF